MLNLYHKHCKVYPIFSQDGCIRVPFAFCSFYALDLIFLFRLGWRGAEGILFAVVLFCSGDKPPNMQWGRALMLHYILLCTHLSDLCFLLEWNGFLLGCDLFSDFWQAGYSEEEPAEALKIIDAHLLGAMAVRSCSNHSTLLVRVSEEPGKQGLCSRSWH